MTGTIRVTCNNPHCFFIGNYHNTTIQSVKQHREFFSDLPQIGDECPHKDVTIVEVQ